MAAVDAGRMIDMIDGWLLAAPLSALAVVGVLACALVLLSVWLSRPERPSKQPHDPPPTRWPADPRAVWDETVDAAPLDRPRDPPRWTAFEEYLGLIESPQRTAGVIGACGLAVGVLLAGALWLAPPVPNRAWQRVVVDALPVLALVQVALGVCAWWPPRRRALLHSQHERAERIGVLCEVHAATLEIHRVDEGRTVIRLFIEFATPDRQAARIAAALERWIARIEEIAGPERPDVARIDHDLEHAWGLRGAVRTEDVFGPGAAGGYLVVTSHAPGCMALLIEMNSVDGDTTRFRWVEKIFFRCRRPRSAAQQPPR